MKNNKGLNSTSIKPDTLVFDLTEGDKVSLEKSAIEAVKNYKRSDGIDIMIIRQKLTDYPNFFPLDKI